MTYRRPGIRVTQEFADLLPALSPFNLPSCIIGPAYQVVTDDKVGTYNGLDVSYAYASKNAGAIVDTNELDVNELTDHQFPITVKIVDATVEALAAADGYIEESSMLLFKDATTDIFEDVNAGDKLEILLGNNLGVYLIREVVDNNTLKLQGELVEAGTDISYRILEAVEEIPLERSTHFSADENTIDLQAGILYNGNDVIDGTVSADYRALRVDLANNVQEYGSLADLQSTFGISQIVPANPLAFGLAIALQNTVTNVNGLGLSSTYLTNEVQAYQSALDVLKRTNMYALVPLTQSAAVSQLFSTHVTQLSLPDNGKERVAICNKKIVEQETIIEAVTTDGSRTIINTQLDGIVTLGADTLQVPSELFGSVQPGDVCHIVGGTGVVAGEYTVDSIDSDLQITLEGFIATYNGADVQFYISRGYGIEANGSVLYDGDAEFLSEGVIVGSYLNIESGTFEGRYEILTVDSETQLTIEQIPGVVSVQTPITYSVDRDMSKNEIAEFMAAYASAFASRRVVITYPDIVKIPEGSIIRELPGFYLGCTVGALTTGLPTHQGFTNLTVSGILGFIHGSNFFDDDQLDTIASGGVMIFDQEVPEAPLYIRHELTTDRSSIKFQEYMVTKNVDYIAKFIRIGFKEYVGVYNIVDSTFDELKTTAKAIIDYLKDETILPRIGGVVKSGKLAKLEEGTNIDSIAIRFKMDIPIPLNNIDITVQV